MHMSVTQCQIYGVEQRDYQKLLNKQGTLIF